MQISAKKRNWNPALHFYNLAIRLYPASGAPHNQLAVIAQLETEHLVAVYHLYRALVSKEPYAKAEDNLEVQIRKLEVLAEVNGFSSAVSAANIGHYQQPEIGSFLGWHACCMKGIDFPINEGLFSSLWSLFKHERLPLKTMHILILTNIGAEYLHEQKSLGLTALLYP